MHRGVRVGFIFALTLTALAAGGGSLSAQSLADGLAQPASRALQMGPWATKTIANRGGGAASWRPVVSVTLAIPPIKKSPGKAAAASHPYGLHGPLPEKTHATMGLASYYGASAGVITATGERFDPSGMTAAHRTLPFGTQVKVTRVDTGDSVVVRINDRGPFKQGRVIDLSEGAAKNLGMMDVGLTNVRLEILN